MLVYKILTAKILYLQFDNKIFFIGESKMNKLIIVVFTFIIMISGYNISNNQALAKEGTLKQTLNQLDKNKAQMEEEGYILYNIDTNCPININDFSYTKIDGLKYQIKLKNEAKNKYKNDNNVQWFFAYPDVNGWKILKETEPLVDFSYISEEKRKYDAHLWKKITLIYSDEKYSCGSFIFPK